MALDIALPNSEGTSPPIFTVLPASYRFRWNMQETWWPRWRREFKYSTVFADETDSKKVQFAEAAELGGRIRMKRGGERKTDDERRWNERTLGSCRLNGTELKSFAWRQARHVVVVDGFSTWQSGRRRHACLLFPVRSYNWNSWKKKRDTRGRPDRGSHRKREDSRDG